MSNFYALKMATRVALHPHIAEKTSFFGIMNSVLYTPTSSKVESYSNYYAEQEGKLLKDFLLSPADRLDDALLRLPEVNTSADGSYRLDLCISHDHQFLAMSLSSSEGQTLTDIRFFEGKDAQAIQSHLL